MSRTKQLIFHISCDKLTDCFPPEECALDHTDGIRTVTQANRYWKKQGWMEKDGDDYCPKCAYYWLLGPKARAKFNKEASHG